MPRILTIPRPQAPPLPGTGCWLIAALDFLQSPLWRERAEVEHDESLLQPIAYLVLLNEEGQAWCYQRAGGDGRLDGRRSCGVGGHVDFADAQGLGFIDLTLIPADPRFELWSRLAAQRLLP